MTADPSAPKTFPDLRVGIARDRLASLLVQRFPAILEANGQTLYSAAIALGRNRSFFYKAGRTISVRDVVSACTALGIHEPAVEEYQRVADLCTFFLAFARPRLLALITLHETHATPDELSQAMGRGHDYLGALLVGTRGRRPLLEMSGVPEILEALGVKASALDRPVIGDGDLALLDELAHGAEVRHLSVTKLAGAVQRSAGRKRNARALSMRRLVVQGFAAIVDGRLALTAEGRKLLAEGASG